MLQRTSRKNRQSPNAIADLLERRLLLSSAVSSTANPSGANLGAQASTTSVAEGTSLYANNAASSPPLTISGTVFNDVNGDGTFDAGDQPLLGHVIFLDVNNNGLFDRGEQRTTTDSNGNYTLQFSSGGTYNIGVVATAGWSMTAPANPTIPITGATGQTFSGENFGFEQTQPTAIVQGKTYGDNNGNGVYDTGDYAGTGTLIYIDVNDNGVFDPGEPGTLADTSSNYSLTVLANTSQVVRADITPLKTNYYTAPASGYYTVSLASNQVAPGYDFAYAPGVSASGSFYDDLNGNGVLDAGEPPLSGWQVNVYQGATLLTTLTTDSNGNFSVNALPVQSGELDFEPVTKSGWLESGVSDAGYAIYAPQVISNLDFFATQLSICAGSVLNDKDWSLSYTSGDAYLPGWTVFADLNHNGQLDLGEPSAVTDKFGDYRLAVPAADDFDLQLVIPSGWRSLMPLSGYWPVSGGTPKRLLDSFYVTNTGGIYGAVFNDLNLDGFYNTNESGVSGVSVYIDTNNDGVWESGEPELLSSSAAPVGSFAFKALAAGTYNIRFITPPGWVPSTDWTNQAWTVTIGTAQVYDGVEFGMVNRPMLVNAGGPYAILEGQSTSLSATAEVAPGLSISTYQWDINYNGTTFNPTLAGQTVTFDGGSLDGPANHSIALRVVDSNEDSVLTGTYVVIVNRPPTATFTAGAPVLEGQNGTVSFSQQFDYSAADVAAGFLYSYDFDGDGTFEITNSTSPVATVPGTYLTTPGAHPVIGRIQDKDGGHTDYGTFINVTASATISGMVYNDMNGNGVEDLTEPQISNAQVYIDLNNDGAYESREPTTSTDVNGNYHLTGIAAGTYTVRLFPSSGWAQTYPSGNGAQVVTATDGQNVISVNFGEAQSNASISGTFFYDTNGNDVWDSGEAISPSWGVFLDTNGDGIYESGEPELICNSQGQYTFSNLLPGTYRVHPTTATNWTETAPPGGTQVVNAISGQTAADINFGEVKGAARTSATPTALFTGDSYSVNLSYAGFHPVTSWTINWGDGSGPQTITGNPTSASHTYTSGSGTSPFTILAWANTVDGDAPALPLTLAVYAAPLLNNGLLSLNGTSGNDSVSFTNSGGLITLNLDGATKQYNGSAVTKVSYTDPGGNDAINLSGSIPATLNLASGNSTVTNNDSSPVYVAASTGKTTINATAGTTIIPANTGTGIQQLDFAAINISAGASVVFATSSATLGDYSNHANRNVAVIDAGGLNIATGGTLDLGDNDLILNYDPANQSAARGLIAGLVTSGYGVNKNFSGTGLTSSEANYDAVQSAGVRALGWADNADLGKTSFDGITLSTANEMLVKFTYYGDCNLDGTVDTGPDLSLFAKGFHGQGSGWDFGDFNYDGVTNNLDLSLFAMGLNSGYKTFGAL